MYVSKCFTLLTKLTGTINKMEFGVSDECLLEISQISVMANKKHHSLNKLFMLKHEANENLVDSPKYLALLVLICF